MPQTSATILDRFLQYRPPMPVGLTVRVAYPGYIDLLEKCGNPQNHLPPVFHVAGTNGKGSTCAFLRAILEATGYRVHVYTSPHLVHFHERIRIAGKLIEEKELVDILSECERVADMANVSYFEVSTAAAFLAFARHPADFTILETGLGGRLDATNVVDKPLATIITRLSYDHRQFLGETLTEIAQEKASIMRKDVPCFAAPQPDTESIDVLRRHAAAVGASFAIGGKDWHIDPLENGFRFSDSSHVLNLPTPALPGAHQLKNAGLAIASLLGSKTRIENTAFAKGLQTVTWPARLQQLKNGLLAGLLPPGWELWLDGGHNDSAGEVLAEQAIAWQQEDGKKPRALHLIAGMIKTKIPQEFLTPLAPHVASLHAVVIPHEEKSFSADEFFIEARKAGIQNAAASPGIHEALQTLKNKFKQPARILICGSLYLAGEVLKENRE